MPTTQKEKLSQFDSLKEEKELLDLYLYDSQFNQPDATETIHDKIAGYTRVQLWRATSASGGYVVIRQTLDRKQGYTVIYYLERIQKAIQDDVYRYNEPIRILIGRMVATRNRKVSYAPNV